MKHLFPMLLLISACVASAQTAPVFACNLKAFQAEERRHHEELSKRLVLAVESRHELPDGYALQLDSKKISFIEVAQWVDGERKCCPFFDFQLDLGAEGHGLRLSLKGREGVKAFIEAEFQALPPVT